MSVVQGNLAQMDNVVANMDGVEQLLTIVEPGANQTAVVLEVVILMNAVQGNLALMDNVVVNMDGVEQLLIIAGQDANQTVEAHLLI